MSLTRWAVPTHNPVRLRQVSTPIGGLTPAAAAYELDCQPATYAVTGVAATVARDITINAETGSYTLTGVLATFEHAIPFNAEPGSYALSGVAATLAADRLFNAEPGTYTLNGVDVTFTRSFDLDAQPGSYTLTGIDATFEYTSAPASPPNIATRAIPSHNPKRFAQVSQTISGLAPTPAPNNYELDCQPATYTLSGVNAEFAHGIPDIWDRVVSPNYAHTTQQIIYGSRLFGGVEVITTTDYELDAQPATYAVTGAAATTARGLFLNAETGSYTLTGVDVQFVKTFAFDAQPGSFTVTGTAATLARDLSLSADPATYTLTGVAADLPHGTPGVYTLAADPGSYAVTGTAAGIVSTRLITASPGSYALTGVATGLQLERALLADPAAYALTGTANAMLLIRVLTADPGVFEIDGADAALGDIIVLGHFDPHRPEAAGFGRRRPHAGHYDSPTPGQVRT